MKTAHNHRSKTPELKMTPMIDVIFLLLIFFVCTANFTPLEGRLPTDMSLSGSSTIEIALPEPEELDTAKILLSYAEAPRWQVEGNHCHSIGQVRDLLRRFRDVKSDLPVIIDSDSNVPMEHVIDVYDACRAAGLSRIQFAANQSRVATLSSP